MEGSIDTYFGFVFFFFFVFYTQLIFLAGSTDVSTEDINALLSQSNTTVSVYTYSLLGESTNSSSSAKIERSVQRLKEMAQTSNGKFEVKEMGFVTLSSFSYVVVSLMCSHTLNHVICSRRRGNDF